MWGHDDGITFEKHNTSDSNSVEIRMGGFLHRLMDGMRSSVAALSEAGNSCIVDDVMLTPDDQRAYLERVSAPIQFVGLHAPLEVLERREKARGDRMLGLARWQWDRVHRGISYDFELDTSERSPKQCASAIASALNIPVSE